LLHLGHAYAALFAARAAAGGRFLVRIEDIDQTRCRPQFEAAIVEDLAWLGLRWEEPVRRQSDHLADHEAALQRLAASGFVYRCFCTRGDIARAATAPHGPEGPVYPGTCRPLAPADADDRAAAGVPFAWRLDVDRARAAMGPLWFEEQALGRVVVAPVLGDVVLARKDVATSYHLAVVVDDAAQGVDLVTRGEDLLAATHIHRLLQALLGLPVPRWHHHRLIRDETGKRLAKRDDARSLAGLRAAGVSPADARALVGFGDGTPHQR
jgi:glutamyl-Q tRNA(Asp) synthetase